MSKSGCTTRAVTGKGNPATPAGPAARNSVHCHGTGEMVPFVNRTFEWGVVIATFLPILSIVPRHCARLTYFLHSKLRKVNAVLITPAAHYPSPAAPAVRRKRSPWRLERGFRSRPGGCKTVGGQWGRHTEAVGPGPTVTSQRGRKGATPPPSSAGPPSAHTPPRTRAQGAWPCPGYRRAGGCPRART